LPSEAEWEYAASGGALTHGYEYSGSGNVNAVVWYNGNSGAETHVVGTKLGNELGIFDMSGNVFEWCFDATNGTSRVIRGGSWNNEAYVARVSNRNSTAPYFGGNGNIGFRVVRSLAP
jgi:formylglycine-generating enzyme required for sulfatase activity